MRGTSFVTLAFVLVLGCGGSDEPAEQPASVDNANVVEIIARGLTLEAPSEIPSGWTTFQFVNQSPMVHFALIERVPAGQGIESQQAEVAVVFQEGLDLLGSGDVDAALARFGDLPAWFGEIVFLGGPGLTSPGRTSQATVFLEPGTYLVECYVKTGGVFHSYNPDPAVNGMVAEFTVTTEVSDGVEPTANLQIQISAAGGIVVTGTPTVGINTWGVEFLDQTVHENFVGHDVHLARVPEAMDMMAMNGLEGWMDWSQPEGLQTPSPVAFIGGLNEMPAGSTGYFTATLEAGRYALIAEVPGSDAKGMFRIFEVGGGSE